MSYGTPTFLSSRANKTCRACTLCALLLARIKVRSICDSILIMPRFTLTEKPCLIFISIRQHGEADYDPENMCYETKKRKIERKKASTDVLEHKCEGYKATSQHIEQTMEWLLSTISRNDEAERRRMNIICRTRTLFTGHNYILRAVMLLQRWTTVHHAAKNALFFRFTPFTKKMADNVPFRAITNGAITLCTTPTH